MLSNFGVEKSDFYKEGLAMNGKDSFPFKVFGSISSVGIAFLHFVKEGKKFSMGTRM